jgi:multiple sugar transport system permease protein
MVTWLTQWSERIKFRTYKPNSRKHDSWKLIGIGALFGFLTVLALFYLMPFLWAFTTSLKANHQLGDRDSVLIPKTQATFNYHGQNLKLYYVNSDGIRRQLAVLDPLRDHVKFIDPANPEEAPIILAVRIITLERVMSIEPHLENYSKAMNDINFFRVLLNTATIALISTFATLVSSSLVAYGFARFRIPYGKFLLMLLIATIILPPQVTYIPLYIYYDRLGLTGTILPMIIPFFFTSAFSVFLLRQYFMTIPSEIDDAAKVDGANPLQSFLQIIIPQSRAALITVALFQFMESWGDYYWPMLVSITNRNAQPLSVAVTRFITSTGIDWPRMMASAVLTMIIPLIIFFLGQRNLTRGIVLTGVER